MGEKWYSALRVHTSVYHLVTSFSWLRVYGIRRIVQVNIRREMAWKVARATMDRQTETLFPEVLLYPSSLSILEPDSREEVGIERWVSY